MFVTKIQNTALNEMVSREFTRQMLALPYRQYADRQMTTTSVPKCAACRQLLSGRTKSTRDPGTTKELFHCAKVPTTFACRTSGRDAAQKHFGRSTMTILRLNTGCCRRDPSGHGRQCSQIPMKKIRTHDLTSQPNSSLRCRDYAGNAHRHFYYK